MTKSRDAARARLEKSFKVVLIAATKRCARLAFGGNMGEPGHWHKEFAANGSIATDPALAERAQQVEKTFHESDWHKRVAVLKEDPGPIDKWGDSQFH